MMQDIIINVVGTNSVQDSTDLKSWLKSEKELDVEKIAQKSQQPGSEEMGSELLPILTIVLASPMISELIKSLFSWLEAKRKTDPISVSIGDKKVTFTSADIENAERIIRVLGELK